MPDILLIEPFFTGSHKSWAEAYARCSRHNIQILKLSGHFWKWRMHGGAVTLARKFMESDFKVEALIATDMLDLTTFLAITRSRTARLPTALYFHENQLTYPWSPTDRDSSLQRDNHYSFINYISALVADVIFFNSNYHLHSFLGELPRFLKQFPDERELESVKKLEAKSRVLPLGLDLQKLDAFRPENAIPNQKPLILWNHRWEYDKNPEVFFKALQILSEKGLEFEVVLLGKAYKKRPEIFTTIRSFLKKHLLFAGYVPDFGAYARWLWRADILPVTSIQDFFGGSVVEAIYTNCYSLLPDRLAYPEHLPLP